MEVSIFGLGYVGVVSAACLANKGHIIRGVDINPEKVKLVNSGVSPIVESGLTEKLQDALNRGNLSATTNSQEALSFSEICLVAIATPSKRNGQIDPTFLLRACNQIAETLKNLNKQQIVVIRSSITPSIFRACLDVFNDISPNLVDLCVNPEFLREGTAIKDFEHPPYTIIGSSNEKVAQTVGGLYETIDAPLYFLRPEEALMIKYASNTFHAMKAAFANEIGILCKEESIDSHAVMKIFCKDYNLNISPKYLTPGFAFGGSCLPKDIRALLHVGRKNDLELHLIQSILKSNVSLIERIFYKILDYGTKNVGLIGLSFKPNTDDLRESPFVELTERLLGKGIDIKIYDPNVSLARIMGANKTYIEKTIPHISNLLVSSIEELANYSKLIVVGHAFEGIKNLPEKLSTSDIILDFCNIEKLKNHKGIYDGISW